MIQRLIFLLLVLSLLSGCSSYINKIYSELDRKTGVQKKRVKRDRFAYFKKYKHHNNQNRISTKKYAYMPPSTKRNYRKAEKTNRRYTTDDLYDNTSSTSLWTNLDADNHLFTQNRKKQNGDIIVVNVFKGLKDRITLELKRAFPVRVKKKKNETQAKTTPETAAAAGGAEGAANEQATDGASGKVFDKISSIVIDQINKDHLLIRGRKNLIYRGRKRTIEIEALVARRSITNIDTIDSGEILESYIEIIR